MSVRGSHRSSWRRSGGRWGSDGSAGVSLLVEDTIDAVFSAEDIRAAMSDEVKPLFLE